MLFSLLLPIAIGVVGMILLIRLRFFFVLHPKRTFLGALSSIKNRDTRRSFFLALAGTLGVGNIFGVSAGLMIGGAGCLFWLFVSSLFSMVIKYAEALLVFNSSDGIYKTVITEENNLFPFLKTVLKSFSFFNL